MNANERRFSDLNGQTPAASLHGRVAVITGAGRGIGFAIAAAMAERGAQVALGELIPERGEAAAAELNGRGLRAQAFALDVTDSPSIEAMLQRVMADFGRIDILVNNAGMFIGHTAEEFPEADWRLQLDVMLTGPFLCATAAAHMAMIPQRGGAIVNISSIGAVGGWPLRHAYNVAKAGLLSLTNGLAVEWAHYNIRVNAVLPGPILTEMLRETIDSGISRLEQYTRRIPMGRVGEMSEVASAVCFLASDRASAITGANLLVDGGWVAYANPVGLGYPVEEEFL